MSAVPREVVYLVYWPLDRVVKVGVTSGDRWRAFVRRGARVAAVTPFDTAADAVEYEREVRGFLDIHGIEAFTSADQARPLLGGRGEGWAECRRVSGDLGEVLDSVPIRYARQACLPL